MIKKCSNCNRLMIPGKDKYVCPYCHNEEPIEREEKQEVKISFEDKLLKYLKTNIDLDVLNSISKSLCVENPSSSLGQLFLAYTKRITNPSDFKKAITNYVNDKKEQDNNDQVITFLIKNTEIKFLLHLENELNVNKSLDIYKKALDEMKNTLAKQHERYNAFNSDVFICYSSQDLNQVIKICDFLEASGITCWYAERNMPKNDPTNYDYKTIIDEAIKNCKIFLTLTSFACMYSDDVEKEITSAEKFNVKNRIEYLLEKSCKHTPKFNHFFEGKQWIDGSELDHFSVLLERISYILNAKGEEIEKPVEAQPEPVKQEEVKKVEIPQPVKVEVPTPIQPEPIKVVETKQPEVVNVEPQPAIVKPRRTIDDGIKIYKAKRYDEALEILKEYPYDKTANGYIGLIYYKQNDYEKAFTAFVRSGLDFVAKPLNEIGKKFYADKVFNKAFLSFARASKIGNEKASFNLGMCFIHGNGCEANIKSAARCFVDAASKGNVPAMVEAANIYMDQESTIYNPSLAFKYFKDAADLNHPKACFQVAKMYYNGFGTSKDERLFEKYLEKAINLNYEPAKQYKEYLNEENNSGCALELDDLDY